MLILIMVIAMPQTENFSSFSAPEFLEEMRRMYSAVAENPGKTEVLQTFWKKVSDSANFSAFDQDNEDVENPNHIVGTLSILLKQSDLGIRIAILTTLRDVLTDTTHRRIIKTCSQEKRTELLDGISECFPAIFTIATGKHIALLNAFTVFNDTDAAPQALHLMTANIDIIGLQYKDKVSLVSKMSTAASHLVAELISEILHNLTTKFKKEDVMREIGMIELSSEKDKEAALIEVRKVHTDPDSLSILAEKLSLPTSFYIDVVKKKNTKIVNPETCVKRLSEADPVTKEVIEALSSILDYKLGKGDHDHNLPKDAVSALGKMGFKAFDAWDSLSKANRTKGLRESAASAQGKIAADALFEGIENVAWPDFEDALKSTDIPVRTIQTKLERLSDLYQDARLPDEGYISESIKYLHHAKGYTSFFTLDDSKIKQLLECLSKSDASYHVKDLARKRPWNPPTAILKMLQDTEVGTYVLRAASLGLSKKAKTSLSSDSTLIHSVMSMLAIQDPEVVSCALIVLSQIELAAPIRDKLEDALLKIKDPKLPVPFYKDALPDSYSRLPDSYSKNSFALINAILCCNPDYTIALNAALSLDKTLYRTAPKWILGYVEKGMNSILQRGDLSEDFLDLVLKIVSDLKLEGTLESLYKLALAKKNLIIPAEKPVQAVNVIQTPTVMAPSFKKQYRTIPGAMSEIGIQGFKYIVDLLYLEEPTWDFYQALIYALSKYTSSIISADDQSKKAIILKMLAFYQNLSDPSSTSMMLDMIRSLKVQDLKEEDLLSIERYAWRMLNILQDTKGGAYFKRDQLNNACKILEHLPQLSYLQDNMGLIMVLSQNTEYAASHASLHGIILHFAGDREILIQSFNHLRNILLYTSNQEHMTFWNTVFQRSQVSKLFEGDDIIRLLCRINLWTTTRVLAFKESGDLSWLHGIAYMVSTGINSGSVIDPNLKVSKPAFVGEQKDLLHSTIQQQLAHNKSLDAETVITNLEKMITKEEPPLQNKLHKMMTSLISEEPAEASDKITLNEEQIFVNLVSAGMVRTVKERLQKLPDDASRTRFVSTPISGYSPLHVACFTGDTEMIKALSEYYDGDGFSYDHGITPLHIAGTQNAAVLESLDRSIKKKQKSAKALNDAGESIYTPLYFAILSGQDDTKVIAELMDGLAKSDILDAYQAAKAYGSKSNVLGTLRKAVGDTTVDAKGSMPSYFAVLKEKMSKTVKPSFSEPEIDHSDVRSQKSSYEEDDDDASQKTTLTTNFAEKMAGESTIQEVQSDIIAMRELGGIAEIKAMLMEVLRTQQEHSTALDSIQNSQTSIEQKIDSIADGMMQARSLLQAFADWEAEKRREAELEERGIFEMRGDEILSITIKKHLIRWYGSQAEAVFGGIGFSDIDTSILPATLQNIIGGTEVETLCDKVAQSMPAGSGLVINLVVVAAKAYMRYKELQDAKSAIKTIGMLGEGLLSSIGNAAAKEFGAIVGNEGWSGIYRDKIKVASLAKSIAEDITKVLSSCDYQKMTIYDGRSIEQKILDTVYRDCSPPEGRSFAGQLHEKGKDAIKKVRRVMFRDTAEPFADDKPRYKRSIKHNRAVALIEKSAWPESENYDTLLDAATHLLIPKSRQKDLEEKRFKYGIRFVVMPPDFLQQSSSSIPRYSSNTHRHLNDLDIYQIEQLFRGMQLRDIARLGPSGSAKL